MSIPNKMQPAQGVLFFIIEKLGWLFKATHNYNAATLNGN